MLRSWLSSGFNARKICQRSIVGNQLATSLVAIWPGQNQNEITFPTLPEPGCATGGPGTPGSFDKDYRLGFLKVVGIGLDRGRCEATHSAFELNGTARHRRRERSGRRRASPCRPDNDSSLELKSEML
jgi:hypothetical protein